MQKSKLIGRLAALAAFTWIASAGAAAAELIVDGDFSACLKSRDLRVDQKGQDWYESRKDIEGARKLLLLSKRDVAGNATPKAMIKGDAKFNTYLTQSFASPQTGDFTVQFDICVREILPPANRSAFIMIGGSTDKKGGPNSTGAERFVFLGFESAPEAGKLNLFAREGKSAWEQKTVVVRGLDANKWYTVLIDVYPSAGAYEVGLKGITAQPVELEAFSAGKKPPKKLTHLSFASWNDGPGTFYIDNVAARSH